jgi:membrane protein implicated in regulation of membrane protease activity
MEKSYVTFGAVMAVLLIAGPSVMLVFFRDYPWWLRLTILAILVVALAVALWPSKKKKRNV